MLTETGMGQFARYVVIGLINTAAGFAIYNALIYATGISRGWPVTLFWLMSFLIVVTFSFFLNAYWVFKKDKQANRRGYVRFFAVTGSVALLNVGVVQLIVNVIGAPSGFNAHAWANVAFAATIAVSVVGNYSGYTFFVFK